MNVLYKVGENGTFLIARISGLNKKKYYGVELKIPKFFWNNYSNIWISCFELKYYRFVFE